MRTKENLRKELSRIDGKGYKAYKDIKGSYDFGDYVVIIDHVQGDPFAAPSKVRVQAAQNVAGFPNDTYSNKSRQVATRDFLTRRFYNAAGKFCKQSRGSGKGGRISIDKPDQEILERTSVFVDDQQVEARFVMGLPAFGRKIAGIQAQAMFFEELPKIVNASLLFESLNPRDLYQHIETNEDADFLRSKLEEKNLVAFVNNNSILPRASGIDSRPLSRDKAVPFESPKSMRVTFELPNRGEVTGMGIEKGITLIVGGGYHGKSTLLNALELGVYNHIPGDGREFVITNPDAIKIRAEDGRRIEKVAIEPFINNLPLGVDTTAFCSENASGSTSQAANIIEALEAGARVLLVDEDTSATNFMIRDHRMQELVAKEKEPITPFIDKARQLHQEFDVSTILVIGGSGDYFDVADTVICMEEYLPHDATENARAVAKKYKAERRQEGGKRFGKLIRRIPLAKSIDPSRGKKKVKIKCRDTHSISFGSEDIDLASIEQLVDISQTRAIADAINYAKKYMNDNKPLKEVLEAVINDIENDSLDVLSPSPSGNYARFRRLELAGALNRLRTLKIKQNGT